MAKEGMASAFRFALAVTFALSLTTVGRGQSFNIDLDVGIGDPGIGHGAPSSSFGGAAGQPGFWNRFGFGGIPTSVMGLDGSASTVFMSVQTSHGQAFGGGFAFTGNTGDYALLLNDAATVGTQIQGGQITYTFSGVAAGAYEVFTYAANVAGISIDTPVTIPGASPLTEVVTGPMPGNALEHLLTHSVHSIEVDGSGEFQISILQPPNMHTGMCVNGFQVALIPETNSTIAMMLGVALCLMRRRSNLDL